MKRISGFTLVEVIVVVAVLAVVFTIATPDLNRLFTRQAEMTETIRLKEIYRALSIYSKKNKTLPNESTWYSDLLEFSELSEDQIKNDVWDQPRTYKKSSVPVDYLGGKYNVEYAFVHSSGPNRVKDITLPSGTGQSFKSDFGDLIFNKVESGGKNILVDDKGIKFTDQAYKLELLEITFDRMEQLSIALSKDSRVRQISGISYYATNSGDSDKKIYFPKDGRDSNDPASSEYFHEVESISSLNANKATALAKILGLPTHYGEDALTDKTMWYISNPGPTAGPDGTDICDNSKSEAPFYPPVIMLHDNNPCEN